MAKKDYKEYTKQQLIDELNKLGKKKKYGLVWEQEKTKEKFENEAEGKLPVLIEDANREVKNDENKPTHILIEGDNYHALSVLNYTHAKSIDVIYIDPPYNTGSNTWRYNNDYVEKEDGYRHSKWLSFMSKRLKLAKKVLKKSGVLVCTIDENEFATLGLLLQEIFPSYQITCVTIVHNPAGIQGDNFSYCHEFAYFVYPKGGRYIGYQIREEDNKDIRNFRDVTGDESLRDAAANCFYPVYIKKNKIVGFGDVCADNFHPKVNVKRKDGIIEIYPIDPQGIERKWRFARQTVESIKSELQVKHIKKRNVFDIIRLKNKFNYKTVWTDSKYSANNHGTQLLNQILQRGIFSFPKSLYAVIDCIKASSKDNKNAIILDFFAGSGTTGHAVLELNKVDGGSRQFILCTNNENDICSDVCYPRVKKVIEGYKNAKREKIEGLGGNLKYYKTEFVGSEPTHRNKKLLTDKSIEMLCIKENTFDKVLSRKDISIFRNKEKFTAILFDELKIEELKKEITKIKLPVSIYVFSLEGDDFSDEFQDLNHNITLCSIPEAILKVYRRIYDTTMPK